MYNAMIMPYAHGPMALQGFLWYQATQSLTLELCLTSELCLALELIVTLELTVTVSLPCGARVKLTPPLPSLQANTPASSRP